MSVARAFGAGSAQDRSASLPVGLVISVAVVAMVIGAAGATLMLNASPAFAWLTAAGLCGGLYVLAMRFARVITTRTLLLALIALACLTFTYLTAVAGASTPRPAERTALAFFSLVVMLLAGLITAAAVPVIIVTVALRSGRTSEPRPLRLDLTPQLLILATGVATFVLVFLLFATALWATAPPWRVLVMLGIMVGSPILLFPFGAYMYRQLLSRWRVEQLPRALLEGLARLRDLTGVEFGEILCLQSPFGSGRVCQVVVRPGRSTLVISESIADELSSAQLLAVLAHEAAHVCLHHVRRKIAWGVVAGITVLTVAVAARMLIAPFLPPALQLAGIFAIMLPLVLLRGLYDAFVTRRHEAEADEFAIDTAGRQALLDALGVLGAFGPSETLVHNRWTTHGTWERRARRIRE